MEHPVLQKTNGIEVLSVMFTSVCCWVVGWWGTQQHTDFNIIGNTSIPLVFLGAECSLKVVYAKPKHVRAYNAFI
jgi:hypothetical protein